MFPAVNSYSNSISEDDIHHHATIIPQGIISRVHADDHFGTLNSVLQNSTLNINNSSHQLQQQQQPQKPKKKRNLPGNPDPDAEVIALSPKTLLATNRFVCEICNKGFQRDQNLQLHRRGHNLPWKLKQRNGKETKKRAYVCPEPTCLHHHPSRALGDLTGIKKHYCRKHGEKKWKCEKCSKVYAVQSDWKAHSKTCGTREYRCDCGTLFSRKDSFITHRAFCDALAEESARLSAATNNPILTPNPNNHPISAQNPNNSTLFHFNPQTTLPISDHSRRHPWDPPPHHHRQNPNNNNHPFNIIKRENGVHVINNLDCIINNNNNHSILVPPATGGGPPPLPLSATALLQKAATTVGSTQSGPVGSAMAHLDMHHVVGPAWSGGGEDDGFTRDFLGLTGGGGGGNMAMKFPAVFDYPGYGFAAETCLGWGKY
ncbi:Protein indeterminate-domain 12 [Striga hermonthica]|uniref:Protein indeterminate-domain 12 n=1 Tax=Striga hermonthica TaxID=68872 RepID=A0A9N7RFR7_STRHE|nr:Protein indeterminate-domain 12 [Striga hermonthica]